MSTVERVAWTLELHGLQTYRDMVHLEIDSKIYIAKEFHEFITNAMIYSEMP